jgi:hypothetical protein
MRSPAIVFLLIAALRATALAACPGTDCFPGGGPASTDCFVEWSGTTSGKDACTDGAACDTDGVVDGACTLPLAACIAVSGASGCSAAQLDAPATVKPTKTSTAQDLASALSALGTAPGCTAPGLVVPLKTSLAGVKAAKIRLTVTAASGGKTDRDKLQLSCAPASTAPSLAQVVQPIFTNRCAYSGCHDAATAHDGVSGNLVLDPGVARANVVGVHATLGKLDRVDPGSVKKSEMARRILSQGYAPGGLPMPQGCPGITPAHGCLTDQEKAAILAWIAGGAPE